MRVFKDIDIISALRKVVDNNNLFYKADFEYDIEAEYHDRWNAILNRYGNPQSVHFNLSREDESKLAEILAAARLERVRDNTISTVGSYVKGMVRERFHDYG